MSEIKVFLTKGFWSFVECEKTLLFVFIISADWDQVEEEVTKYYRQLPSLVEGGLQFCFIISNIHQENWTGASSGDVEIAAAAAYLLF